MNSTRNYIICPKCRSIELELSEIFEARETWIQNNEGVILNIEEEGSVVGPILRVEGSCSRCNHVWKIRGVDEISQLPNWIDGEPQETINGEAEEIKEEIEEEDEAETKKPKTKKKKSTKAKSDKEAA